MSVDKQQTWAEAVVECVDDVAERTRLLQLYEPDEMAAALLRQVAIANALRSALTCCEEERRLGQEELRTLRDTIKRLEGRACLLCGKDEPCMTEADLAPDDPGVPCTFDPSPIDAARRFFEERNAARAEVERLRMQLAACGVVALANTPESASKAREMHPDYNSASCQDVARAVDEQMALREKVERLETEVLVAAGMLSTTPGYSDQHPQVALDAIRQGAAAAAAINAARKEGA